MRITVFQVTQYDVGYNGNTKRDIGKWCIVCGGASYWRKTEHDARDLAEYLK